MSTIRFLILMITMFLIIVVGAYAQTAKETFTIFDATLYQGKPDLSRYGLTPLRIIYAQELWNKGESRDEPNKEKIIEVAKSLQPNSIVCVDIEHWHAVGSPENKQRVIAKYKLVMNLIKKHNPTVKVGYYGMLPVRDYWRAIGERGEEQYNEWVRQNDELRSIADSVDVVFPSLYTLYDDPQKWELYAVNNLKEAKKYNKPIYPFLWPMYHDGNSRLRGQYIPTDFWRRQLETVQTYADGIVIWGGYKEQWSDNALWWVETKKFIKKRH